MTAFIIDLEINLHKNSSGYSYNSNATKQHQNVYNTLTVRRLCSNNTNSWRNLRKCAFVYIQLLEYMKIYVVIAMHAVHDKYIHHKAQNVHAFMDHSIYGQMLPAQLTDPV